MNNFSGSIPIDLATALERTGEDMDFLEELIDMFIEDFQEKYIILKDAIIKKDANQVLEIAHNLKGSAANLGLPPLQETFFQLETAGRDNNLIDANKKMELLQTRFTAFIAHWENRDQMEQDLSKIESTRTDQHHSGQHKKTRQKDCP